MRHINIILQKPLYFKFIFKIAVQMHIYIVYAGVWQLEKEKRVVEAI